MPKGSSEITTPSKVALSQNGPDLRVELRGELEIWKEYLTQWLAMPITGLPKSQSSPHISFSLPSNRKEKPPAHIPPPLGTAGLSQVRGYLSHKSHKQMWALWLPWQSSGDFCPILSFVCSFVCLILSLSLLKVELGVAFPLLFTKCQIFSNRTEKHEVSENRLLLNIVTGWHTLAIKGIK